MLYPSPFTRKLQIHITGRSSGLSMFLETFPGGSYLAHELLSCLLAKSPTHSYLTQNSLPSGKKELQNNTPDFTATGIAPDFHRIPF